MGLLNGLFGTKSGATGGAFAMEGDSMLFFFLLLVIIFCNTGLFAEDGCGLLFFFLLLVLIFCGGLGAAESNGSC